MKRDSLTMRHWILLVVLCVLVAVHLWGFHYLFSHLRLSTTVLAAALLLIAIKHWGLLGFIYELLRRRPPR